MRCDAEFGTDRVNADGVFVLSCAYCVIPFSGALVYYYTLLSHLVSIYEAINNSGP